MSAFTPGSSPSTLPAETSTAVPLRRMAGARLATASQLRDHRVVGGKLARQRVMQEKGLAVPAFFALTAQFFDEVFATLRPQVAARLATVDFSHGPAVKQAAAEIRRWFSELSLSAAQTSDILSAFDRHFPRHALVAVRASTIGHRLEESEDSADNPFAGMSETFLYVSREEVLEKVRHCWGSGFSEESLIYRHAQGMDLLGFSVGVAVQQMVMGQRSFVLFTVNPRTAARETVIAAGHGIGEGVVQDKVATDHYFVHGGSGEIRAEIVDKPEMLGLDTAQGRGLAMHAVPEAMRCEPVLSAADIATLVQLGRRIEALFGAPQDIEGTFDAQGQVHVLQARPIALDHRRMRVWTNANVTESFPGVTTALTYSFSRYFYRVIFHDCYRRLGMSARGLHEEHEALDRMIGFVGGRVYYCLTHFYHLHARSPLFPIFRAHWEKMMGFRASYEATPRGLFGRALRVTGRALATASALAVVAYRYLSHEQAMRHFHTWWEGLIAPLRGQDFEDEDLLVLEHEFHRVWREVGTQWGVTLLNDTYLPVLYGLTENLFSRWGLAGDEALLSDLLCGDDDLMSVEIVRSAVRLAERVRAVPSLREAFEQMEPSSLWEAVTRNELDAEFCEAARMHCHRYGDRGLQELKIEQPNMRHTPELLIQMVQSYVGGDVTVQGLREREQALRQAAEQRLRAALSGAPLKRLLLAWLLPRVRGLIRHRENSRYCRSELFGFSKNIFRAMGRRLTAQGVLQRPEDVYHLSQDELFGWIDGTGVTSHLQALADLRRQEFAENEAIETAMDLTTLGPLRDNALQAQQESPAPSGELRGLGSSTGKVRGRARVVIDPNTAGPLDPGGEGAILVARETDPGWLFLMLAAKGMVVERGSMLSHTAITGRKFGIPTIVSLPGATTRIPDGAWIEMDGASGRVEILALPRDGERPEGQALPEAA